MLRRRRGPTAPATARQEVLIAELNRRVRKVLTLIRG
jgi:hypothetical protein